MGFVDRIRTALMSVSKLTIEALERQNGEVVLAIEAVRGELDQAEADAMRASLEAGLDDLSLARIEKKPEALRAKLSRLQEQQRRLTAALAVRQEEERAIAEAEQRAAIDATCAERVKVFAELDAWAAKGGGLLKRAAELSESVHEQAAALRSIPDWPAMFGRGSLPRLVFLRLYSFAGELAVGGKPHASQWEAKKLPSLADRAAEERSRVMSQLAPQVEHTEPPPRAA